MRQELYENSKDYINRWIISYADFVTILFALFIVMWAISGNNVKENINPEVLKQAFNINEQIKAEENEKNLIIEEIKQNKELIENVEIIRDKKGLILRSNNSIFFEEGSADLTTKGENVLSEIAKELSKIENPIIIEGHTDSTPINNIKFPSNWELSTTRATNIVKFLINNYNFSPKRLSAVGYGEFSPVIDNDNVKNRSKNRRVDIIILSNNN